MLLPNMTYSELIKEFNRDYEESVLPRLYHINNDNKYRRFCLKLGSNQFHAFKPIEFKTKRNNQCVIYLSTHGKSDFRASNGLHSQLLMKIQGARGINYMTKSETINGVEHCIFSYHLFERYAERKWGRTDIDINKIILEVVPQLNHVASKELNDKRYPNGIFSLCPLGIFLGEYIQEDNFMIYKTFVSFDLLHSNQEDICQELTPLLEWLDKEMPNNI